jgi:hypothetical protein
LEIRKKRYWVNCLYVRLKLGVLAVKIRLKKMVKLVL